MIHMSFSFGFFLSETIIFPFLAWYHKFSYKRVTTRVIILCTLMEPHGKGFFSINISNKHDCKICWLMCTSVSYSINKRKGTLIKQAFHSINVIQNNSHPRFLDMLGSLIFKKTILFLILYKFMLYFTVNLPTKAHTYYE